MLEKEMNLQYEQLLSLVPKADLVIGASIQLVADFVTEGLNVPYYFIAYAPTIIPLVNHSPITIPLNV